MSRKQCRSSLGFGLRASHLARSKSSIDPIGRVAAALALRSTSLRIADIFPFDHWMSRDTRAFARNERNSFPKVRILDGSSIQAKPFLLFPINCAVMIVVEIQGVGDDNHARKPQTGSTLTDVFQRMYARAQFHSVICSRLISFFKEHFIGAVHVIRKFGDSSESARPSWVLESRTVDVNFQCVRVWLHREANSA